MKRFDSADTMAAAKNADMHSPCKRSWIRRRLADAVCALHIRRFKRRVSRGAKWQCGEGYGRIFFFDADKLHAVLTRPSATSLIHDDDNQDEHGEKTAIAA